MPIEFLDDWEQRLARQNAFWDRAIIDRPVVCIVTRKPQPVHPWPAKKTWAGTRERWMDAEYLAELALAGVMNADFHGDALPAAYPNLGPEIFSAFFGTELQFGDTTSWSVPNLDDWAGADRLQCSRDNVYWRKLAEMTDALLDAGRGRFYTGMTDWHPGADAIAAFRDPARLALDLIERPAEVRKLLRRVTDAYFRVFDFWWDKLAAAGQAMNTWIGIVSARKWYVPSNDFSCMISKEMFDDLFLPGIAEECRFLENSVYHLDGPGALRHLDSLLAIPELSAVQYVYNPGERASQWIGLYRKCQAAGKGVHFGIGADELDTIMDNLRPQGVWMSVGGIKTPAEADAVIRRVSNWR